MALDMKLPFVYLEPPEDAADHLQHLCGHLQSYDQLHSGERLFLQDCRRLLRVHRQLNLDAMFASYPISPEHQAAKDQRLQELAQLAGKLEQLLALFDRPDY